VAWYLVILFAWALKPLEDAVPVGVDPATGKPVSQTVECNTLFAGTAHDGNLPVLTNLNFEYNRTPCVSVQSDARKIFALDTLVAVVLVGGLVVIALRPVPRESRQIAVASAGGG
jgi:hypothetical protein